MKGINKKFRLGVTIALLVLVNFSAIVGVYELRKPIITTITNLDWSETNYDHPEGNYSFFDFAIDYRINNTAKLKTEVIFPYCNLEFLGNISACFEDENLEIYYYPIVGLCAIGETTIEPGITTSSVGFILAINKEGLTNLPDGNYSVWVYFYGVSDILYNVTTIVVDDGAALSKNWNTN